MFQVRRGAGAEAEPECFECLYSRWVCGGVGRGEGGGIDGRTMFDLRKIEMMMETRLSNKTLHATAVGVAFERRSVRSILLFPSEAGAHPAVRELGRSA